MLESVLYTQQGKYTYEISMIQLPEQDFCTIIIPLDILCAQKHFNRVPPLDEEQKGVNKYWEGNQFSLGPNSYIDCQVPRGQS